MLEPISRQSQDAYRNTLDTNQAPAEIDSSIAPIPVAVTGLPLREIKFASGSVLGAVSNTTLITGSGRGQWITCINLSAETSADALTTLTVRGGTVMQMRIRANTSNTFAFSLSSPIFVNPGDVIAVTSNSANMNTSATIHYFDK